MSSGLKVWDTIEERQRAWAMEQACLWTHSATTHKDNLYEIADQILEYVKGNEKDT